ncbi:MAG: hypothetical protein U1E26_08030 [Coriobacteriia bacterium]|nr:hypothetical protein [Coriobacteriia bacterium]
MGAPDIAVLAGTSAAGARKALERLVSVGFVEKVGGGRAPKYRVRDAAVAREPLTRAFELEARQYDQLIRGVREAVAMPEVSAAWCEPLPLDVASALGVSVVVGAEHLSWARDEIRSRLAETEQRFDLIVEVAVYTKADAPPPGDRDIALWGVVGGTSSEGAAAPLTHAAVSARSLRAAQTVAAMVVSDPTLIRRAARHLDTLIEEGQGMATADLVEWRQLLRTYSPQRVSDLLVSASSRAERLRRSAPFFAVLTPEERDRVLEAAGEAR